MQLAGRTVWITGAGSGIGRAIACAFAQQGARIALSGRSRESLEETAGLIGPAAGAVEIVETDVTDAAQVAAAHRAIVGSLGDPHILVNNAGSNVARRHWKDLQPESVGHVVDVNLKGPFHCTIAVLPAMRARREGTIIHIASLAGVTIGAVSGPAYTAAKHGARALSATLNAEEGIHGIRSICINPGEVATPILDRRPAPPSAEQRALMVQPEDIAAAAVFAAMLPARSCVADMTITPTDNAFWRATARRLAGEE